MKTHIGHLVFAIDSSNSAFYRELFTFLGWQVIHDGDDMLGLVDDSGISIWFGAATQSVSNDYDGPGLNHVAIATATQADVDATAAYLAERGVAHLFETPRHRPDFAMSPDDTYYQVMFETPDRIQVEVVYTGPRAR